MKQQNLKEIRDYRKNPRSSHEEPDRNYRGDTDCEAWGPSLTKQSEAAACDINNIMAQYFATGLLPGEERAGTGVYGDFSTMETYHEAQEIIAQANSAFYALPAQVRAEFANDPARMLEYVELASKDEAKAKRLIELGLAEPKKEVKPVEDPQVAAIKEMTAALKENTGRRKNSQQPDSSALSEE